MITNDVLLGALEVREVYRYDKAHEAFEVYRTTEEAHPGVAALYAQGDTLVGGPVTLLPVPADAWPHATYTLTPLQTREAFALRGWRSIVGFQTRNPVHRAHEYIQKCALETLYVNTPNRGSLADLPGSRFALR